MKKQTITYFLLLISFFFISLSSAFAWTNPLTLKNEWSLYGIGDPYILKYRGTYYLYASTKDHNIGTKCWYTKDFVNWSDAIMCSTDPITKTAYAPEVYYWNGKFYMYTSPSGNGHYVLSSDSPTGPFVRVTENVGRTIDGSIYVDDDGKWYFYYSGHGGIRACAMSDPTTFGQEVHLGASIANNWTEGPCVFKRNGIFYMIYTGNHVISKGYRFDYARNTAGPLSTFTPLTEQNPILINTEGDHVGLGHGSAFIGPDLDSYYLTYHNLAGDYGVGPYRRLNFDRIAWNGDKMIVLGPTTWHQEPMQLADMADFFDRNEIGDDWDFVGEGNWQLVDKDYLLQDENNEESATWSKALHKTITENNYTAEFSLKENTRGNVSSRYGVIFNYQDENNYGYAVLKRNANQIEFNLIQNGTPGTAITKSLPNSFNHSTWHHIRIENYDNKINVYIDGMLKIATTNTLQGGKIGYTSRASKASFSYIAFSNKTNGSGIFNAYKPIPGSIEAVHYIEGGQGIGYHDLTPGNTAGRYIRNDDVDIRNCSEGGYAITDNQAGEWYQYHVNVKSRLAYNLGFRYSATNSNGKIRIWQDDIALTEVISLASTGSSNIWKTLTIKGLQMDRGLQKIKIEIVEGGFDFYSMRFVEADNSIVSLQDNFSSNFNSHWNYRDGTWAVIDNQAVVSGYGKRTMGHVGWTDYTVETDVTYTDNMNGGLIFRVKNPALGGAGRDAQLGTDFYQGYFVTLNANAVVLGKQNYNWKSLQSVPGRHALNTKYKLKVEVKGSIIKVFVDDMDTPKIEYEDLDPFINGKVGLRAHNATVKFDNFSVSTTADEDMTAIRNPNDSNSNMEFFFPNPVRHSITINPLNQNTQISIFNLDGSLVLNKYLPTPQNTLNLSFLEKGFYLIQMKDNSGYTRTKRFFKI